jgi:hypothetical protein
VTTVAALPLWVQRPGVAGLLLLVVTSALLRRKSLQAVSLVERLESREG